MSDKKYIPIFNYTDYSGNQIDPKKLPSDTIFKYIDSITNQTDTVISSPLIKGTVRPDGKPAHCGILVKDTVIYHEFSLSVDKKLKKYISLFDRCEREIAVNFESANKDYKVIYRNISQILAIYDFCLTDVISPYLEVTKQPVLEKTIRKIVTGYHVQLASLFNMVVEYIKTFAELREELENGQSKDGGGTNSKIQKLLSFNPGLIQLIDADTEKNEEINEIRIDQTWFKIDSKLFPVNTQLKANQLIEYLQSERLLFSAPVNIPRPQVGVSTTNNYFSNTKKKEAEQEKLKAEQIAANAAKTEAGPIQIKEKSDIIKNATKITMDSQKASGDGKSNSITNLTPINTNLPRMSVKSGSPVAFSANRSSIKSAMEQQGSANNLSVELSSLILGQNEEERKVQEITEMLKNYEELAKKIQEATQEKKSEDIYAVKNTILNINASFSLFKSDSDKLKRSQAQDAFGKHNYMFRDSIYKVNENLKNLQSNTVYQPPPKKKDEEKYILPKRDSKPRMLESDEESESNDEQTRQEEQKEMEEILRNKYVVNQRLSTMSSEKTQRELGKLLEDFKAQRANLNSLGNDMRKNIKNMDIIEMNKESDEEDDYRTRKDSSSRAKAPEERKVKKKINISKQSALSVSQDKETSEIGTQIDEPVESISSIPVPVNNAEELKIISLLKTELSLIQEELESYKTIEKPKLLKTIEELRQLIQNLEKELELEMKENAQLTNNVEDYKQIIREQQANNEEADLQLYKAKKEVLELTKSGMEKAENLEKMDQTVKVLLNEKDNMRDEIKYLREELDHLMNKNEIILDEKKKSIVSLKTLTFKNKQLEKEITEINKERITNLPPSSKSSEKSIHNVKKASVVSVVSGGGVNDQSSRSSVSDKNRASLAKSGSFKKSITNTSSGQASFLKKAINEIKYEEPLDSQEQKPNKILMNTVVDLDKMTAKVKGKYIAADENEAQILKGIEEMNRSLENEKEFEISVAEELSRGEEEPNEVFEDEENNITPEVSIATMNKTHPLNFSTIDNDVNQVEITEFQEEPSIEIRTRESIQKNNVPNLNFKKSLQYSSNYDYHTDRSQITPKKFFTDVSTQSSKLEPLDYLNIYLAERHVDKGVANDIEELVGSLGKRKEPINKVRKSNEHENEMPSAKKAIEQAGITQIREVDVISETHDNSGSSPISNYDKSLSTLTEKRGFAELDEDTIKSDRRRKKSFRTHSETNINTYTQPERNGVFIVEEDKYQRMYENFKRIIDKGGFNVIKNSSTTINSMFKSVFKIPEGVTDWKNLSVPNFDDFKESIRKMQVIHIRCGAECPHLKRFYEFLGYYQSKLNMKPVFVPHKRTITRLPKIKNVSGL